NAKFTYLPFCSDNANTFYGRITRRYRSFGFRQFQCLAADQAFSKEDLRRAMSSDVIYLAGGNTFYFLFNIKLASIPRFDADENDVGLKDLDALGLTTFEFSPHYSENRSRNTSLLNYS